ncbi:MAG: MFS transporter [Flavobacteriales bacterium AspAUS03]
MVFFRPLDACWLDNAFTLISFRLIDGLGIGVSSMIYPLYINEFSPAALRGSMVNFY